MPPMSTSTKVKTAVTAIRRADQANVSNNISLDLQAMEKIKKQLNIIQVVLKHTQGKIKEIQQKRENLDTGCLKTLRTAFLLRSGTQNNHHHDNTKLAYEYVMNNLPTLFDRYGLDMSAEDMLQLEAARLFKAAKAMEGEAFELLIKEAMLKEDIQQLHRKVRALSTETNEHVQM